MNEIYKVVIKAEDYPNCARAVKLEKGDSFILAGSRNVKVGDKYENYPAIISHIYYKPKKWWQFWKKKEMLGCQILWLGED
jgi:hypothetical protein